MKRTIIIAILILASLTTSAQAAEDNGWRCRYLESLNATYAGVTLTAAQQALKRRLVAWYNRNCRSRRAGA